METPQRIVGVARLATFLKQRIEETPGMKNIAVRGEISNLRIHPSSGHCYFSLKEQQAVLPCIVFANNVPFLPPLRDGAKVVAQGSITTYAQQGIYQLRVATVRFEGEGELFAAFEILRHRLDSEGLFAVERKRQLPRAPFHIALVSSSTADGTRDFRTVLARRAPHIRVTLFETIVQGDAAPARIVAALEACAKSDVEVVVLVRGGGSFEDLFVFSHESVVRAIDACPVPVVTGIGHESDVTLADHVADLRASTPTDAANKFSSLEDLRRCVSSCYTDLVTRQRLIVAAARTQVGAIDKRLERVSPGARLERGFQTLRERRGSLDATMIRLLALRRERVASLVRRLDQASLLDGARRRHRYELLARGLRGRDPHALLELGYAIVSVDGRVVSDASEIPVGTLVAARLARGTVQARVEITVGDEREAD